MSDPSRGVARSGLVRTGWAMLGVVVLATSQVQGSVPDPADRFEAARAAYDQDRLDEAATLYRDLLREGQHLLPVYFNLGNALYRSGRNGEAIWSWHRARMVAPRDAEVRANLDLAERATGAPPYPVPFPSDLLRQVSEAAWWRILLAAWWVALPALALGLIRPTFRRVTRPLALVAMLAACLAVAGGWSWRVLRHQEPVVVTANKPVSARFAPLETAGPSMVLPPGTWVATVDRRGEWREVQRDGQRGWIRETDARVVWPLR